MCPQPCLVQIFLAEDHSPDVTLIKESLTAARIAFEIERAADGERALERLLRYRSADRPHVIILDLNLPRIDGFAVLTRLRENPALLDIPVMMVSSSTDPSDREHARRLGAAAFVSKPPELDEFMTVVATTVRTLLGLADGEAMARAGGLAHAHTHGSRSDMNVRRRYVWKQANAPDHPAINSAGVSLRR
jgi:two-component system, chemotaxis family, response regulator Rcp1